MSYNYYPSYSSAETPQEKLLKGLPSKPIFNNIVSTANGVVAAESGFMCSARDGTQIITLKDGYLRWGSVQKSSFSSMRIQPMGSFVDQNVIISQSGDFLCIYTKDNFKVVEIPWGYSDLEGHMSFEFQSKLFNFPLQPHIKQILFHPRATNDSSLVILFEDDTIILFDTRTETEILLNDSQGSFGMDSKITDIKSLSFSKDGLILYVLSTSDCGDLYAFYPCLPGNISFDKLELKELMQKAILLYNSLDSETSNDVKKNIFKQLKFISALHSENLKFGKTEFDIESSFRKVKPQGPFTISPYPEELYETTANDIFTYQIGESNELLMLTFDNGTILSLFRDLEMSMCWDFDNYFYSNSMVLIERIDNFKNVDNSNNILQIFKDFNQVGQILVYSPSAKTTYNIITKSWSEAMDKCIENSDISEISKIEVKSQIVDINVNRNNTSNLFKTEIQTYANTEQKQYTSCGIFRADGQTGVIFVGPQDIVAVPLNLCDGEKESLVNERQSSEPVSEVDSKFSKLDISFSQPMSEIMDFAESYKRRSKNPFGEVIPPEVRQAKLENSSNEKQLDVLTTVSKGVVGTVVQGQSLGVMLHARILEQQYEFSKQIKGVNDVIEKQEELTKQYKEQSTRLQSKINKQTALMERLTALNQRVLGSNESALVRDSVISNQEIAWFKEIRNQIYKFNEFVHNQKSLQEELGFVKQELNKVQSRSESSRDKSEHEWKELRKMLEQDAATIKQCNEGLQKATKDLDTGVSV